jgi:hypothetical protein
MIDFEFTQELKDKWVTALRSGEYQKSEGQLREKQEDGTYCYCAMGVLCDVFDPNGWSAMKYGMASGIDHHNNEDDVAYGNEWKVPFNPWTIMQMSDGTDGDPLKSEPATFEEIADYVEKNIHA